MQLKPFQEVGRDYLASHPVALLADEMRLGKTAQAITAARAVRAKRILVVCPAVARTHWHVDFGQWWPTFKGRLEVVSYDYARANTSRLGGPWCVLILDECHYLKNPERARTRAIFGVEGVASRSNRCWALSGTPAPNHVGELWPLLRAFGCVDLDYEPFLCRYCVVDAYGKVRGTKKESRAELKAMVQGVMLRRTKKQVAPELPVATVEPYYIEPDPEYMDLACPVHTDLKIQELKSLEARYKEELKGLGPRQMLRYLDSAVTELATLRRLHAVLKIPALLSIIEEEVINGPVEKLVVFGYHRNGLRIPHELLKNRVRCDILYGGTPPTKRDRILERFNAPVGRGKKGTRVLFASIGAAGTAIDLSAAHNGVLLERDWVPANNAQAIERMGGHKQTSPIHIRDLRVAGSVDDVVGKVLARKMKGISEVI